jgi:hypothetical protein
MFEINCSCRLYSLNRVLYSCLTCCMFSDGPVDIGMFGFELIYLRGYILCQIIIHVHFNIYYQFIHASIDQESVLLWMRDLW